MSTDRVYMDVVAGTLRNIQDAADPKMPLWSPYVGNRIGVAVWYTRYLVRQARILGLWKDRRNRERREVA